MSRFPSLATWSGHFGADDLDLGHIRSIFSSPPEEVCVFIDATSGTNYEDESSDAYWGTDDDWELIDQRALSGNRIDRIADYLKSTGEASA